MSMQIHLILKLNVGLHQVCTDDLTSASDMYRTRYKGMMLYLAGSYDICKIVIFSPPSNKESAPQIQHCDNYFDFFFSPFVCLFMLIQFKLQKKSYIFLHGSIGCQKEVPFHGVHILFPRLSARGEGLRSRRFSPVYPLSTQSIFLFKIFLKYQKENLRSMYCVVCFFFF